MKMFPGDRKFLLAKAAHASDDTIFSDVSFNPPPGFACREIVLVPDLTIDIIGGSSMTSVDEIMQAIEAFTIEGGEELLRVPGLTGDEIAGFLRLYPPRGKDFWDIFPNGTIPTNGGGPQNCVGMAPVVYGSNHYPGSEKERWPTEFLRKLSVTMSTVADSAWVTLGTGTVTGSWYLYAICYPATRLILPAPLDLEVKSVAADTEQDLKHKTFYNEVIGRQSIGTNFDGTDVDSLEIGGTQYYPTKAPYLLSHDQAFALQEREDIESTTAVTRYLDTQHHRLLGGRSELGDEVLKNTPMSADVLYTPETASTLFMRRRRRWNSELVKKYGDTMKLQITGGAAVDKDGKAVLAISGSGSTLPLDTGLSVG